MPATAATRTSEQKTQPQAIESTRAVPVRTDSSGPYAGILRMQRAVGNRAVNQIIQTRLILGMPGDRYEVEADRVADQILQTAPLSQTSTLPDGPHVQRKCAGCSGGSGECQSCAEEEVRLKPITPASNHSQAGSESNGTELAVGLARLQSGGLPLSRRERDFFEPRLGRDLSQVRIHANASAAESARSLRAHAFTTANHVVFAAGGYASQTPAGLRLLAHELVHVVQQSGGAVVGTVQRQPDDARVHTAGTESAAGSLSLLSGVPYEKWSETIEQQYRARGDLVRANAVKTCRTQGGAACAQIITATESMKLHALAKSSGGDEGKIKAGLASAAPLVALQLVQQASRAAPLLSLVPPPPPAAGLGLGGGAAIAGPAVIVAVCVIAAYQLWELGKFQDELRAKGFIILEDPLALCIGGCHMPSRPPSSLARDLPPLTRQQIEDWLPPEGSRKRPQPTPVPLQTPVPAPAPQPKSKKCSDARVKTLHDEVDKHCKDRERSCTMQGDTCASAKAKVSAGYACTDAREKMQKECFQKGDDGYEGHMLQISEAYAALRRCEAVMAEKCKEGS